MHILDNHIIQNDQYAGLSVRDNFIYKTAARVLVMQCCKFLMNIQIIS